MLPSRAATLILISLFGSHFALAEPETPPPWPGDEWRKEHRIIDLHQHIDNREDRVQRAIRIMDRAGVGIGVNLTAGTVTPTKEGKSEFEATKELTDRVAPGRFVHYFNLDYTDWNEPDFAQRAVQQAEKARKLGAAGFKEYKRLGLYLRDGQGNLIKIDDPKLDPLWERCGELGLPVSVHVADPRAFWLPYTQQNERWTELRDHKSWWFGDPKQFPSREDLLAALDRVITRHPKTTFVCVHFANNSEDIDWVDRKLDEHPNMNADLAARIPELGRHDPEKLRRLFIKHQDRIYFATDFQVYDKLILGSSGDAERPTDDDAVTFFHKEWRFLETRDRNWPHMTPIQGDWNISAIGLPPDVLRKIYFDNSRRLLANALPFPTLTAKYIAKDFKPDGKLNDRAWSQAVPFHLEQDSGDGRVHPDVSTTCRAVWSDRYLYLGYECPFTTLTEYGKPDKTERIKAPNALWDKDVVELFVAPDATEINHYTEYEWAPNNEALDLRIERPHSDFEWTSRMEWNVRVDTDRHLWTCEVRIPITAISRSLPSPGTRWRVNLYRIDRAHKAFLALNPTLNNTFHTPERFGWLEFQR
ncbi:MAG TPA: amidohydrolase family protein [Candidatus Limnocylindria bacterium]|nr:amidohydrolase family protein [Candidatus Limnocylindria bacterium]